MTTAIAIMRKRATVLAEQTRQSLVKGRFVEELYERKISDLENVSFRPLAGFTVIFGKPYAPSTVEQLPIDTFVKFDFVEYMTGFRLTMLCVVQLDEGYLPIGVVEKAVIDATVLKLEELLNTCGYTLDSAAPPGLRAVTNLEISNPRLGQLFKLDRYLGQFYYDPAADVDEDRTKIPAVEFSETDTHVVFKLPTPGIALAHQDYCEHLLYWGRRQVLIPTRDLGVLANLRDKRLWAINPNLASVKNTSRVTDLGTTMLSDVTRGTWNEIHGTKWFVDAFDFQTVYSAMLYENAYEQPALDISYRDGYLVLEYPKDWLSVELRTKAELRIDNPEAWLLVTNHGIDKDQKAIGKYDAKNGKFQLDCEIKTEGRHFNLKDLEALRIEQARHRLLDFGQEKDIVEPEATVVGDGNGVDANAIGSATLGGLENIPFEVKQSNSFFSRLTRAWHAFQGIDKK
jgi:hypothetical protein